MFENEQKYIIKTADDIRRIQEGFKEVHSVSESRHTFNNTDEDIEHLITNKHNTKIPLWWCYMFFGISMVPAFATGVLWISIWWTLFVIFPLFLVFTKVYNSSWETSTKKIKINWLRLYTIFGYCLIPVSFLYEPFEFLFLLWLFTFFMGYFIWAVVTLRVEEDIRECIDTFQTCMQDLQQMHSWAIFDMSLDFYSPTIYPQQVIKIRDSIERVTAQIQQLLELQHRMSDYYQKWFATFWSVFFSKKLKEQMQSFFRNESNQLLIYVNTFSQDLNFWTERHKMELSQLEENIDQQKEETILPEWKLALELSQDRISRLTQEASMIRTVQK